MQLSCASSLSDLTGVLSSRALLSDLAAREGAAQQLIAEAQSDAVSNWNRVAASCYQLELLTTGENDPVGRSFELAYADSAIAFTAENNRIEAAEHYSTGGQAVIRSFWWARVALRQVRDASVTWIPFVPPSTPEKQDFHYGCLVDSNGDKVDSACTGG